MKWKKAIQLRIFFFFAGRESIRVRGNIQLQNCLESLENTSITKGLSPEHITDLVDVIGTCKHGRSTAMSLVMFTFLWKNAWPNVRWRSRLLTKSIMSGYTFCWGAVIYFEFYLVSLCTYENLYTNVFCKEREQLTLGMFRSKAFLIINWFEVKLFQFFTYCISLNCNVLYIVKLLW